MRSLLATWTEQTGDTVPSKPTPDRQAGLGSCECAKGLHYNDQPGDAKNALEINHPGPIRIGEDG